MPGYDEIGSWWLGLEGPTSAGRRSKGLRTTDAEHGSLRIAHIGRNQEIDKGPVGSTWRIATVINNHNRVIKRSVSLDWRGFYPCSLILRWELSTRLRMIPFMLRTCPGIQYCTALIQRWAKQSCRFAVRKDFCVSHLLGHPGNTLFIFCAWQKRRVTASARSGTSLHPSSPSWWQHFCHARLAAPTNEQDPLALSAHSYTKSCKHFPAICVKHFAIEDMSTPGIILFGSYVRAK